MPGLHGDVQASGAVSFHQTGMPPHLLRLFEARPPLPWIELPKRKRPLPQYSGVGAYLDYFDPNGASGGHEPSKERVWINPELGLQCRVDQETRVERFVSNIRKKNEANAAAHEEASKTWDPHADPNVEGEPLNTLFVANLSHDVSERKLQREFETFGPIKRIRVVHDKYSGKPKGYAFIEFEDKEDMKEAYKVADGTRIEGKRCIVDVERGRVVPHWKPKRLGGGKHAGSVQEATLPRDPSKQRIAKLVFKALDMDIKPPVPVKARNSDKRDDGASRYKRDRYDHDKSYERYDSGRYRGSRDYRSRSREDYSSRRYGGRYDDYDDRYRHEDDGDYRLPKRERLSYGDEDVPPPKDAPLVEKEDGDHSPEEGELA